MLNKFLFFLKYNNAVILILAVIFIVGTGVFAASEPGQEFIGQKESEVVGVDNTLLFEVDPDNFDMDFKIEKIEEDSEFYYITYTYLDLAKKDNAWQYQLNEKNRKISKTLKKDLGLYLAEEFKEEREAKIADLKKAKIKAEETGKSIRQEVSAYSGLIGKSLDMTAKLFDGYEPIKKIDLPSPTIPPTVLSQNNISNTARDTENISQPESLSNVYNDYMARMDPDNDGIVGALDNCPDLVNVDQSDIDQDGIGDACEPVSTESAEEAGDIDPAIEDAPVDNNLETNEDLDQVTNNIQEELPDSDTQAISEEPESVEIIEIN